MVQFNPIESLFSSGFMSAPLSQNGTDRSRDPYAPTPEEREAERVARRARMRERNERVQEAMKKVRPDTVERISNEELASMQEQHPSLRKLGWSFGGSDSSMPYVDPGEDYDMWQQAYRMLGGFIDCDHAKSEGSHDSGNNNNNEANEQGCSRWMLWASVSVRKSRLSCSHDLALKLSVSLLPIVRRS